MNLPNKISIFRLILIPFIIILWIFPFSALGINIPVVRLLGTTLSINRLLILLLFITASISDFIDGKIARKKNLITTFGKFIDPIADKCLTTTLFILLAIENSIITLPVIVMICRDIIVDGCRMIAASQGEIIHANIYGKIKTASQMITIIFGLLANFPFDSLGIPFFEIGVWFSCIISVVSGIVYYQQIKKFALKTK